MAKKLSVNHATLRHWVWRAETDSSQGPGLSANERVKLKRSGRGTTPGVHWAKRC